MSATRIPIGAVGLLVIAVTLALAFNVQSLPLIGGGAVPGGLQRGRRADRGRRRPDRRVKVGKVEAVDLAGDHVQVDFRITEDVAFGPRPRPRCG